MNPLHKLEGMIPIICVDSWWGRTANFLCCRLASLSSIKRVLMTSVF